MVTEGLARLATTPYEEPSEHNVKDAYVPSPKDERQCVERESVYVCVCVCVVMDAQASLHYARVDSVT